MIPISAATMASGALQGSLAIVLRTLAAPFYDALSCGI
jgi:hypothetical protein